MWEELLPTVICQHECLFQNAFWRSSFEITFFNIFIAYDVDFFPIFRLSNVIKVSV